MGKIYEKVESTPTDDILYDPSESRRGKRSENPVTPSIEIVDNSDDIDIPSYSIHYKDSDSENFTHLNFSNPFKSHERNNSFPEYTATLKRRDRNSELWKVNSVNGSKEEVLINSSSNKHELAYKLENAYHSIINQ